MSIVEFGDFRGLSPPRSANAIITDPPYNIGHDYGDVSDRLPECEYVGMMGDFATWAYRNTEANAHLFVVHRPEFFFDHGREVFVDHGGWERRQSIRWCYPANIGHSSKKWTTASREIVWFTKGDPYFDPKADSLPYKNPSDKRVAALIADGSPGIAAYDWWEINLQKNVTRGYAGYANQLPQPLLKRMVACSTQRGEMVVDPFAGTGSTLIAANALGRDGWGCDANGKAPAFKVLEQERETKC